jgi:hypothetical protein
MISPESAIESDHFPSVGEKAQSAGNMPAERAWVQDAELRESSSRHPAGLWLGVAVAMPVALGFWALVWFVASRALHP